MDDDIRRNKKYAVVKFLTDSTFSEIPIAWLLEDDDDNQLCWWPPRTCNSAILIANCATPNFSTWTQYEVEVVKYCCKYFKIYTFLCQNCVMLQIYFCSPTWNMFLNITRPNL